MDFIMKPCDLVLVQGDGFLPGAIERITDSPYHHVAGLVKTNELLEAQAFRKTGYRALDYYAEYADVFTCDLLTDEQRGKMAEYLLFFVGYRYSYLLIGWEFLRYTFGVALMPKKAWDPIICSTLWADGYRYVGIDLCPGILFPSPADLADSKLLRKVGSF